MNEEVRFFKEIGGGNRILCFVIEGTPNASDNPRSGLLECFPESVRYAVEPSGFVTSQRSEPVAADARLEGDGLKIARVKLVAGLIGVDFDELQRREHRRQRIRQFAMVAILVLAIALLFGVWRFEENRRIASAHRADVEKWIENGRREWLAGEPQRALAWLATAWHDGTQSPSLRYLLGRALQTHLRRTDIAISPGKAEINWAKFSNAVAHLLLVRRDGRLSSWSERDQLEIPLSMIGNKGFTENGNGTRVVVLRGAEADVIDSRTGNVVSTLKGHELDVQSVVFSLSGAFIATGGADNTARIWSASNGQLLTTFRSHSATVNTVAFSPDDELVASGGNDDSVFVWRRRDGTIEKKIDAGSSVNTLAFDAEGRRLKVYARSAAFFFDLLNETRIEPSVADRWRLLALAFDHPKATLLAALTEKGRGNVLLADAQSGKEICTLEGHGGEVLSAEFSRDARRLLTTSWDKTVRVWDALGGRNLLRAESVAAGAFGSLEGVGQRGALSADGHRALRVGADGTLSIWSLDEETRGLQDGSDTVVGKVFFSNDGSKILSLNWNHIRVWDANNSRLIGEWKTSESTIARISTDPSAQLVCVLLNDSRTVLWEPGAAAPPMVLSVAGMAVHPSAQRYLVITQGTARLMPVLGDTAIWQASLPVGRASTNTPAQFSQSGAKIALTANDSSILILNAESGAQELHAILPGGPTPMKLIWATDEKTLFVVSERTVIAVDASSGRMIASTAPHDFYITDVALSPDGRYLATADGNGLAKVWTRPALNQAFAVQAGSTFLTAVSFSPDGAFLITASGDRGCRVWETPSGRLLDELSGTQSRVSPTAATLLVVDKELELRPLFSKLPSRKEIDTILNTRNAWKIENSRLVPASSTARVIQIPTPAVPSPQSKQSGK